MTKDNQEELTKRLFRLETELLRIQQIDYGFKYEESKEICIEALEKRIAYIKHDIDF